MQTSPTIMKQSARPVSLKLTCSWSSSLRHGIWNLTTLGCVAVSLNPAPANAQAQRPAHDSKSHHRQPLESVVLGVPRTDANSQRAHQQLIAKAQAGRIDLYFLGDSITRRWGCTDPQWADLLENWKQNFFGWNAANFGWGADGIRNMLWRVQHGELDEVHPKVIVILAGTNDVGNQPGDPRKIDNILVAYRALLAACHEKAPGAKIIVTAIFPRNDNRAVLPEIRQINRRLQELADDQTIYFLDVNARLAKPDGTLFEGMSMDGLHLTVKGYQAWADGLRPRLTELLGPPSPTDHAPPPTGDPSLQE